MDYQTYWLNFCKFVTLIVFILGELQKRCSGKVNEGTIKCHKYTMPRSFAITVSVSAVFRYCIQDSILSFFSTYTLVYVVECLGL